MKEQPKRLGETRHYVARLLLRTRYGMRWSFTSSRSTMADHWTPPLIVKITNTINRSMQQDLSHLNKSSL